MWLRRKEAAAHLSISPSRYDAYRKKYGLPARGMGSIRSEVLDAWWTLFQANPPKKKGRAECHNNSK